MKISTVESRYFLKSGLIEEILFTDCMVPAAKIFTFFVLRQWLAIDPMSGEPPLHGDITSSNLANQDREMQALSVWDREDPFTWVTWPPHNLNLAVCTYMAVEPCPHWTKNYSNVGDILLFLELMMSKPSIFYATIEFYYFSTYSKFFNCT